MVAATALAHASSFRVVAVAVAVAIPVGILAAKLTGLYDRDHQAMRHLTVDELPQLFLASAITSLLLAGGLGLAGRGPSIGTVLVVWGLATALGVVLRAGARRIWRAVTPPETTLIVGDGALASMARRRVQLFPDLHLQLVDETLAADGEIPADVDRILLASSALDEELLARLLAHCRAHEIKLSVVPPLRGMFGTAARLNQVADLPVVVYNTWDVSRSTLVIKRFLDVGLASVALLVLSPVFAVVALAILLRTGRPIVYSQLRAGLGGRPFRMFKFRTMVANADELLGELIPLDSLPEPMFKLHADPRVTRLGRFLRRWSLDELPQLVNVVKGEMSLVGPRPEQVELVARYTPAERFRLDVKPGLTGPMQVYGRGELDFEERLAVERDYIENLSLGRDLRIIALTLTTVVSGRGAY